MKHEASLLYCVQVEGTLSLETPLLIGAGKEKDNTFCAIKKDSPLSPEHLSPASFAILPITGIKRRRSCSLATVTTAAEKACRAPFASMIFPLKTLILPFVTAFPSTNTRALPRIRPNMIMKSLKEGLAAPSP